MLDVRIMDGTLFQEMWIMRIMQGFGARSQWFQSHSALS